MHIFHNPLTSSQNSRDDLVDDRHYALYIMRIAAGETD